MAMTMCGPDGEEEHSQVYYVIKVGKNKTSNTVTE